MNSRPLFCAARNLIKPRIINSRAVIRPMSSGYHGHDSHDKPVTLDDMPVPQGSWQKQYDAQQKKYNLHLVVGVSFFVLTCVVFKTSGLVFFNACIPPLPEEEGCE